jgi:urease accessory protein
VRAATRIEVGVDGAGATVVRRMRCEVPLLMRIDGVATDGSLALLLVNGAAGPLGGDELELVLVVADDARVRVRSVAASLVQPGPAGLRSVTRTVVEVAERATLDWELEPTVSVLGSRHGVSTVLHAASSASVTFSDAVQLGRYQEQSGTLSLRQRVVVGGRAVLDHETDLGPGTRSSVGGNGAFRWVQSRVVIADDAPTSPQTVVDAGSVRGVFPLGPRSAVEIYAGSARTASSGLMV